MKKLLILGGFPQMIEVVSTAKMLGIHTIVVDQSPGSPAKRFADKSYDISTADKDELLKICKVEQIDGVFTGFEDFNIHIACDISKKLNLPFYATSEQLNIITNKHLFKNECKKYDIPVVTQYTIEEALQKEIYPYIIKPVDSYGSRGITVCHNREELYKGYEKALASSKSRQVVIERFIDSDHGTELFYTIVNGNIHLTVTADRYTVKNGITTVPLPVAEVFPSCHTDAMLDCLDQNIRKMLTGMGLKNGLVLIQALYLDGEFFVYEMAYRLTGEQHYRLVEKQHGINLSKMMIMLALGEDISEFDTELLDYDKFINPSINYALILHSGKIKSVVGLSEVYKIDEVISYNLTHSVNDVISPSGDYSHMLIRINMVANNYDNLCRAVEDVNKFVKVESQDGEDMLVTRFSLPLGND